ncbi:unnamed protein product [Vitrella brassicaformis CCMP3155]|uniref:Prokaryotic-type class I peptide chain release factors domain-containing protein n=1 Tax=Vitrella brassicaformis (strain CCMP3155) TaxID=1169540 RepID=A0A0G4ELK2_VITBC|nr:unnamed protein product [Vitrella brassicaformis CCMP3155]|eukprot:CEL98298.1 unnamed protein product [Vitrella brassicaformis CCMP3155]
MSATASDSACPRRPEEGRRRSLASACWPSLLPPAAAGHLGWCRFGVRHGIVIPRNKIDRVFLRNSGPGGQSVNTSDTKVRLRFNLKTADWIPDKIRERLLKSCASKLTKEGDLMITAGDTSSAIANTEIAFEKLQKLLDQAESMKERNFKPFVKDWIHEVKDPEEIQRYEENRLKWKKMRSYSRTRKDDLY